MNASASCSSVTAASLVAGLSTALKEKKAAAMSKSEKAAAAGESGLTVRYVSAVRHRATVQKRLIGVGLMVCVALNPPQPFVNLIV